jgi:quercetin dioxygenase-like cupin family protein
MGFIDLESRARKDTFPGAYIKTFWAEKMMIARVTFAADTPVPLHSHPAEQAGVIIEGSYAMVIGDERRTLHAGDMYIVPGDVVHGGQAGPEGFTAAEVFAPVRDELQY